MLTFYKSLIFLFLTTFIAAFILFVGLKSLEANVMVQ